jgi:predicted nucleic acid-binding protein
VIILDANVLGALMRASPDIAVIEWLDRQPAESVWITSITLFETLFDLALLPSGRRRQVLESAFVIWKTASWISIAQQQPRLPRWQRRGRQAGEYPNRRDCFLAARNACNSQHTTFYGFEDLNS